MRKAIATTAALSAAALALGVASPASAEDIGVKDPSDTNHGSDLRSVVVRNTDTKIHVTTTHENLKRDFRSGSAGAVYIDTRPADKGPEFVFVGAYFQGSDYSLLRTEDFGHRNWGGRVNGTYEMRIDYDKEQVRMHMSRGALGRPDDIRVGVRVAGSGENSVDWLGDKRSFTRWVDRG